MKKFLVLYMAPVGTFDEMMKNATPEQQQEGMDKWMAWGKDHKADIADFGAPAGQNKRVTKNSIEDVRNEVTGYSIVQAESHEAAATLVQDSPHLEHPNTYIEVVTLMDM